VPPSGMEALEGVTEIDTSAAVAIVNVVALEMEPEVAVIFAVPVPELVASPAVPLALLMTATFAFEELQVTVEVTSCVLPSVYVPVAVNCCVVPRGIDGVEGLIAIETRAAGRTLNVAEALMDPAEMLIVVDPALSVVATPWVPCALLIVATLAADELQWPV
jgi:hypothetical protein